MPEFAHELHEFELELPDARHDLLAQVRAAGRRRAVLARPARRVRRAAAAEGRTRRVDSIVAQMAASRDMVGGIESRVRALRHAGRGRRLPRASSTGRRSVSLLPERAVGRAALQPAHGGRLDT